jgi:plastocyanin
MENLGYLIISIALLGLVAGTAAGSIGVSVSSSAGIAYGGQNVTLSATAYGGTPPYSYNWSDYQGHIAGCNAVNATCMITVPQVPSASPYTVYVSATDSLNVSSPNQAASITLVVYPALEYPTAFTLTSVTDGGQSAIIYSTNVTTGIPPYYYQWLESYKGGAYINATSCEAPRTPKCVFSGVDPGVYNMKLLVTDSGAIPEQVNSTNATVTVNNKPTISLTPSSTGVDAGQSVTFTNTTTGTGLTNYTYSTNATGATVIGNRITFSTDGTYSVMESVTDAIGVKAHSNAVTITVSQPPTVSASPPQSATGGALQTGQPITFNSVTTGQGPFNYTYSTNAPNAAINGSKITFQTPGTYSVTETVKDGNNDIVSTTTTVTVGKKTPPASKIGYIAIVIVGLLILVIAIIYFPRRRKGKWNRR